MKRTVNCNDQDLVLFHYGDLDAETRLRVREHLTQCHACRLKLAGLRDALDRLPVPELCLSEGEKQRFAAVINDRIAHKSRPRQWLWGSALATLAVLTICLRILPGGPATFTGGVPKSATEIGMLQDMELLQNLDLLENLDLLQDFDRIG